MDSMHHALLFQLQNLQNGLELVAQLQSECKYSNSNQKLFVSVLLGDLGNSIGSMKEIIENANSSSKKNEVKYS